MKPIGIETSSFLPLVWNTPYTPGLWSLLIQHVKGKTQKIRCLMHQDSIREAQGYFLAIQQKKTPWMYNPAHRLRALANNLSPKKLNQLPFPSTAFAVILGGSIWPQATYLNYARHCGFLYGDLVDQISEKQFTRKVLAELADNIEKRTKEIINFFDTITKSGTVLFNSQGKYPYWGRFYNGPAGYLVEIVIHKDPLPYNKMKYITPDAYHYAMMLQENASVMIVADGQFEKNTKEAGLNTQKLRVATAASWKFSF